MAKSKVQSSIRRRWSHGFFWTTIGAVASQGSILVAFIILANILGKEAYGRFGMLQSTMVVFASIAQIAMGATARKYVAEFRTSDFAKLGRIIGMCSYLTTISGIIASAFLLLCAPLLADKWLRAPDLKLALQLTSIYVFFVTVNGYQIGVIQGLEQFKKLTCILIIKGLLTFILICLLGLLFGVIGSVIAMGIVAFIIWLISYILLRSYCHKKGISVSRNILKSERKIFTNFAIPASLSGWAGPAAIWIASSFLVRNAGFSEMAIFFAFWNIRSIAMFIPQQLMVVANSILNNLLGEKQMGRYCKLFWANVIAVSLSSVVIVIISVIMIPWIAILYGEGFANGYLTGTIIFSSAVVESYSGAIYQSIQNRGKMWIQFGMMTLWGITLTWLSFIWTKPYSASGLGAAYLVSWGMVAIIYTIISIYIEPSLFFKKAVNAIDVLRGS